MDAYWRAANYLTVGQIYLQDNPLLEAPLTLEHIKPRLLGHWGTTTGINFIYVHLNRLIKEHDLNMIYVIGPGHGGPGLVAHSYLEGSYTERYPNIERSRNGLQRLFRQFSWPYGIPSHVAPETPGSIHEGGELGYSLLHAYGAAFDNPDLIVTCIIGDGEAETGALAASWHSNKFLNPARDGAVLPILHLNGFKIANPTVLARISRRELTDLIRGYGYEPHFVEGDVPVVVHQSLASTLDKVVAKINEIQHAARSSPGTVERPRWPMIVFRTPKGWTGPKFVDGKPVEGTWRAHQVPIADLKNPEHLKQLEDWMKSYRPHELFDERGKFRDELAALAPTGHRRMSANPHANGGELLQPLSMPHFQDYAKAVLEPGSIEAESTRILGSFLRDVMKLNLSKKHFRLFGPDETASNRLEAVYEVSGKEWMADVEDVDIDLSVDGRVMEVLSEHLCEGWLEGYLLTGRHGLFSCYEAFIHVIDSMFNQHAKWLKASRSIPWRKPIASLNYLLTSHVWRQDHNGFSHQDPGFIDHVANKKADIVRIYLPPDANCLLSVADHCLRSRNYINLIIIGKQPEWQWLDIDSAVRHCTMGRQRRWRSRRGNGLCRRCADSRDARGGDAVARICPRHPHPRGQRGGLDGAAASVRASPRFGGPRFRRTVHDRQAGDLRLPRLSCDDSQADLPPSQPRQYPRARLQGGGHHHDPLRHGRAEQSRPLSTRAGRHPANSTARRSSGESEGALLDDHGASQALYQRAWRRHAGGSRLALELLSTMFAGLRYDGR
jgi:xylulose-5-phosphate/fructose-6-phosphate phosphoketolase